jgi:hypothetical protein
MITQHYYYFFFGFLEMAALSERDKWWVENDLGYIVHMKERRHFSSL